MGEAEADEADAEDRAATGMMRMSPRTLVRAASESADASAPTPMAPIRKPSVCGPPWSTRAAKIGMSTTNGHAHEADDGKEQQDGADGEKPGDVGPPFVQFVSHGGGWFPDLRHVETHGKERGDDGDVADAVDEEAPAFAGGGDQHAGERGADEAGDVDHGGVDGDGVAEVGAVVDHLHHEGLAAGHVEAVDDALRDAEDENPGEC